MALSVEELTLLQLLCGNRKASEDKVCNKEYADVCENTYAETSIARILKIANDGGVLPVLCDCDRNLLELVAPEERTRYQSFIREDVLLQYKHLHFLKQIGDCFSENQIPFVVLKGFSIACFYEKPELRKASDIDLLLLHEKDIERASFLLSQMGFEQTGKQHGEHHIAFFNITGCALEVHKKLTASFPNKEFNLYVDYFTNEIKNHVIQKEVMGITIPVPEDAYLAMAMLIHMAQHFFASGFGLRLLWDWRMFWSSHLAIEEKHTYVELLQESPFSRFSELITETCICFLKLPEEEVEFMNQKNKAISSQRCELLLRDIFDGAEAGHNEKGRMMVLARTDWKGYFIAFHSQMKCNFPGLGRMFLLWPVLWLFTLVKFLVNNRVVRRVSVKDVLETTGQRSRLIKQLGIFTGE